MEKWWFSERVVCVVGTWLKTDDSFNQKFSVTAPTVNNVSILANFNLPNGNEVFLISEVLFMSEAVVSRLHQVSFLFFLF